MAFISQATRFGTQSFYSNGQLIGLTTPNAYGMGSVTYAPFAANPTEHTMEHPDGSTTHFDGQGNMTGTSYQDQLGNNHFFGMDGHSMHECQTTFGANIINDHGEVIKHLIGDSQDAGELATKFLSGSMDFGDDLFDQII